MKPLRKQAQMLAEDGPKPGEPWRFPSPPEGRIVWSSRITPYTCEQDGHDIRGFTCQRCGYELTAEDIAKYNEDAWS